MNHYRMMKLAANKHKAHLRPHFAYRAHYSSKFKSCVAEGAYGKIKSPKAPNYEAGVPLQCPTSINAAVTLFTLTTLLSVQSLWKNINV